MSFYGVVTHLQTDRQTDEGLLNPFTLKRVLKHTPHVPFVPKKAHWGVF